MNSNRKINKKIIITIQKENIISETLKSYLIQYKDIQVWLNKTYLFFKKDKVILFLEDYWTFKINHLDSDNVSEVSAMELCNYFDNYRID